MKNFKEKLTAIKALVFDIDGVLTDGSVTINSDNSTSRSFFSRDGFALQKAVEQGLIVAIISSAREEILKERFKRLGLQEVYLGSTDKEDDLRDLAAVYNLLYDEILFMGDDLPDYNAMKRCGLAVCPDDASPEIRAICDYISPLNGGKGCVRDIIEQVLRAQGKW